MAVLPADKEAKPDWDAINRGKVRCNLVAALVSNGVVDPEQIKRIVEPLIVYVFEGK